MIWSLSFELEALVSLGKSDQSGEHSREDVLARFNDFCADLLDDSGEPLFMGLTEGVLLAEEAHERGYETESWVLDEGMAPHERDWLSQEHSLKITSYFKDEGSAGLAKRWLLSEYRFKTEPQIAVEK